MEIERKFRVVEGIDIAEQLAPLSNGESFIKKGTEAFIDTYLDTDDNQLCTKDVWLRRRDKGGNARWELKYRPTALAETVRPEQDSPHEAVRKYIELTDETEIASVICCLLRLSGGKLDAIVDSTLNEFCRIDTVRDTYELDVLQCADVGPATVVIDRALDGAIALGEVEIQLDRDAEPDQQNNAELAINAIVTRFGTATNP